MDNAAIDYWDKVASKVVSLDGKSFQDNFAKRRLIIKELLEFDFTKKKVLEVGTGLGVVPATIRLLYGELDYKGTDLSPHFAQAAQEMFGHEVTQADITKLPFEDNEFDVGFFFDILEHVPPNDRTRGYFEVDRVLKDKAVIFINNPLTQSLHDPNFDFSFSDEDIYNMASALGMTLTKIKMLECQDYYYQFIAMSR